MTEPSPTLSSGSFEDLLKIMASLRDPKSGCPWDIEQTFATISPYTIEEAYEVADAIERNDLTDLKDELGDLLLQVVFHSQIASEMNAFTVSDVIQSINSKMVRRHPHVFGNANVKDGAQQTDRWERIKAEERKSKSTLSQSTSAVDGVARALPALLRAEKLQKRAARSGFDWEDYGPVFEKLNEEVEEVREAIAESNTQDIEEEVGDLLFVVANLARKLNVDPEQALRFANSKFEKRFRAMEQLAKQRGDEFAALSLEQQEALWGEVKSQEV